MRGGAWMRRLPVVLLMALAGAGTGAGAGGPAVPQSRMDEPQWAARFDERTAALARGPYDLVLFGDSITRELEVSGRKPGTDILAVWRRWFACRRAIELGFSGDTTANLLWRIENGLVPAAPPKLAVVLIGTNNQRPQLGWTAEQTTHGIVAIVEALHARLHGTPILLLGVPPNGHGPRINGIIDQVNAALAKRDWSALNTEYLATKDVFLTGGTLDASLFRETAQGGSPLHPNADGWERLAQHIMPSVSRRLGGGDAPCR